MKRKLAAVLLTLCLVMGLLPMSAFAVWTTSDGTEVQVSADGKVTIGGTEYIVADTSKLTSPSNGDTVDYYSYYNGAPVIQGTLTWRADVQEYTVTFDWNYEGAPEAVKVTTVKGIAAAPEAAEREGFVLKGWATAANAAEPDVDLTKAFTKDTTVYAVWVAEAVVEVPVSVEGTETAPIVSVPTEAANTAVEAITNADPNAEVINVSLTPSSSDDVAKIENADQATIQVPAAIVNALEAKLNDTNSSAAAATIEFPKGGVTDDKDAVSELKGGDLTLTVTTTTEDQEEKEAAAATAVAAVAAPNTSADVHTVISVDLKVGNTVINSTNPLTKNITVSVKVDITISAGATPAVWWLPGGAAPVAMSGVQYADGVMSWLTKHCSDYAFGETTITTPGGDDDVTITPITPVDDVQGKAFNVTGRAGQAIVYDVQTGSTHTILWSQIGANGTAKVVVAGSAATDKVAIWVADSITWDAAALKYNATGNIAAYEWSK